MMKEEIALGDLIVKKQIIGVADEIDIPLLDDVVWDGILGLAYPNSNLKKQSIRPLFDNIMDQGLLVNKHEKNQFAYFLGKETGAITFGGADMRFKADRNEEFQWAPIKEENYWTISVKDVRKEYNNKKVATSRFLEQKSKVKKLCPDGCKTIVDTGTYLVYGPQEVFQNYLSDIMIDNCNSKSSLPDIIFELQGEGGTTFDLRLRPDDYVLHFKVDGVDDCVIGIAPDTEDTGWTFGQVFLRAFYTIFDRDENRIGFARSNTGVYPQPGTSVQPKESQKEIQVTETAKEKKVDPIPSKPSSNIIYSPEPSKSFIGVVADTSVGPSVQVQGFNTPIIEQPAKSQPKKAELSSKAKFMSNNEGEIGSYDDLSTLNEEPLIIPSDDKRDEEAESIFMNNSVESNEFNEGYLHNQINKSPSEEDSLLKGNEPNVDNLVISSYLSSRRRRRRLRRRFRMRRRRRRF